MKSFRSCTAVVAVAIFAVVAMAGFTPRALAAQAAPAKEKKVKDQGEYDLFNSSTKETDPNKKIELLKQWQQKYPDSDYKEDRLQIMLQTYIQLNQADNILNAGKELLALNPKNVNGLYWEALLVPSMGKEDADSLSIGEKAANGLINAEKPAGTKDEDWAKAKTPLEALGHKTLGWINWKRKNLDIAEQELVKSLQVNADQAEVSSWLGTVIFAMKKPERQSEVLYHFARAAVNTDPQKGGQPEPARKATEAYLERAFNSYHGADPEGLAKLKEQAKASALPPQGFKIKTATEIAEEKEKEFTEKNPQLALWMRVKKELVAAGGEQYFDGTIKNAMLPKFKGTVISGKPPVKSAELVVGIENPQVAEITLKLDKPLAGKPKLGGQIEFEGVPTAFTKDPFNLTLDTERAKITGLEVEGVAAPPRAPVKKAPVKKR